MLSVRRVRRVPCLAPAPALPERDLRLPARSLLLLVLSCACLVAVAAQFEREGPRLIVVGALDADGAEQLVEHLAGGAVRTVMFENSFGGTPEVGSAWAETLRRAGVATEITGQCHGACAIAFLAGRSHRFAAGLQVNGLLIPLAARPGEVQHTLLSEFVDAALHSGWQPTQGLLFTSTPTLFGRIHNAFWCDGRQGRDTSKCQRLADVDPFKLGVLTP